MLAIFIFLIVFWIFGPYLNIKATTVALFGLGLLLLCNVLTWGDVLKEESAWDTFIWFATLVTLATFLNKFGFIGWISEQILETATGYHWMLALSVIVLVYLYSHYLFASTTAHACAMFPAFLMVAIGVGAPPYLAILILAYFSNLCGGLTHYGSGPAPVFYGSGYITVVDWWRVGGLISIANIILWGIGGALWWKTLGIW
jgi:divalent anion:Na+ symporter, DASS family